MDRQCESCVVHATNCAANHYLKDCGGTASGSCELCASCKAGQQRVGCATTNPGLCETCKSGKYATEADDTCQTCNANCAPGSYETAPCTASTNRQCSACPAGYACSGGTSRVECGGNAFFAGPFATRCSVVKAGHYSTGGTATTRTGEAICPAGYKCESGQRTPCEELITYQSATGKTSCVSCSQCARGYTAVIACKIDADTVCRDVTPPAITLYGQDLVIELGMEVSDPMGVAQDSLDGPVELVRTPSGLPTTIGTYILNYTATDAAGNVALASRSLVLQDTTPPTLTLQGPVTLDLAFRAVYVDPGYTVDDASQVTTTVQGVEQVNTASQGTDPGPFSITYRACDTGSLCTTKTRQVYFVDNSIPIITLKGGNPITKEVDTHPLAAFEDPGYSASDNVHGEITQHVVVSGRVDLNTVGQYTLEYNLGYNGETARTVTRTVNVQDSTRPTIRLNGDAHQILELGSFYTEFGYTVSDNYDSPDDIVVSIRPETIDTAQAVNGSVIEIQYMCQDTSGNRDAAFRYITIIDTQPPVLTTQSATQIVHEAGNDFDYPTVIAQDPVQGDLAVTRDGAVNVRPDSTPATFTLTYSAIDPSGLEAFLMINVTIQDTLAPELTFAEGDATVEIEAGGSEQPPKPVAIDLNDGPIAVLADKMIDLTPASLPSTTTITYTATDLAGHSTQLEQTVTLVDTMPPQLALQGSSAVDVESGRPFTDPGISCQDLAAGECVDDVAISTIERGASGSFQRVTRIDTNRPAGVSFIITYSVADPSGNEAAPITRTVMVVDTTAPEITINLPSLSTLEASRPPMRWPIKQHVRTVDVVDGNVFDRLRLRVTVNGNRRRNLGQWLSWGDALDLIDTSAEIGTVYKVELRVTDKSNNQATEEIRLELQDSVAPTITLKTSSRVAEDGATLVEVGTVYIDVGAIASDGYDGNITADINVGAKVNTTVAGQEFIVVYDVSDSSNNSAYAQRIVRVVDTISPQGSSGSNSASSSSSSMMIAAGAGAGVLCIVVMAVLLRRRSTDRKSPSGLVNVTGFQNPAFRQSWDGQGATEYLPEWYQPNLSREAAEQALASDGGMDGTYVVTDGAQRGQDYRIYYQVGGRTECVELRKENQGVLTMNGKQFAGGNITDVGAAVEHLITYGSGMSCSLTDPVEQDDQNQERLLTNAVYESTGPLMVPAVDLRRAIENGWPCYVQAAEDANAYFQLRGSAAMLSAGATMPLFHAIDSGSKRILPPRPEIQAAHVSVCDYAGEVDQLCVEYDAHWAHLTQVQAINPSMMPQRTSASDGIYDQFPGDSQYDEVAFAPQVEAGQDSTYFDPQAEAEIQSGLEQPKRELLYDAVEFGFDEPNAQAQDATYLDTEIRQAGYEEEEEEKDEEDETGYLDVSAYE
eukprot:TRINITY_DN10485_c0_g3_i3.p1 TRINITY_DN10485_c0_g3~~TRINITY_DN10485_c0_g3_i3.p1  ORF type:complete len:1604 (+),score=383.94 TRINITY_DN10485_c0_g3_i3:647-4813(+)